MKDDIKNKYNYIGYFDNMLSCIQSMVYRR